MDSLAWCATLKPVLHSRNREGKSPGCEPGNRTRNLGTFKFLAAKEEAASL